jgi:hypothetical protein
MIIFDGRIKIRPNMYHTAQSVKLFKYNHTTQIKYVHGIYLVFLIKTALIKYQ